MWAEARAAGVGEREFWSLTPHELNARLSKIAEKHEARQRAAALRAGLIASTILNTTPGVKKRYRPQHFVRSKPRDLSPEQVRSELLSWARAVNNAEDN